MTLQKSVKQTNINLKQRLYRCHCFLASRKIVNLNALSGIIEVDETFFLNPLNRSVIFHIGNVENTGDKEIKIKNKLLNLNQQNHVSNDIFE